MELAFLMNRSTILLRCRLQNLLYSSRRYAAGQRRRVRLRVTAARNSGDYSCCYALRADMVVQVQYLQALLLLGRRVDTKVSARLHAIDNAVWVLLFKLEASLDA